MTDLALLLLQNTDDYSATGIFRFFAGLFLVLTIYVGALSFTHWIGKDE